MLHPDIHTPDSLDLLADGETLDLGSIDGIAGEVIEMNMQFSLLNHTTYNISILHDLDGVYIDQETTPVMADEKAAGILWVLMTSGFFHRIRIEALEDRQRFDLNFCEATMAYQGQLS